MPPPDVEVARIATAIPGRVICEEVLVARVHQTLLDKPEKSWKFSASDVRERRYRDDYMNAYEEVVRATATRGAPWYVVPADHKWFTRLVVAAALVEAVEDLDLTYPTV